MAIQFTHALNVSGSFKKANMNNGFWIVKGARRIGNRVSRSTISNNCVTYSQAEQVAEEAINNGYEDIEMYFHEDEDEELGPAYGSFSEALEYDFSQN